MNHEEYPKIFIQSDNLSIESQNSFLSKIRINGLLGLLSALTALVSSVEKIFAYSSILSILFLTISVWSLVEEKQKKEKYRRRTKEENKKSLTRKYMIGGEPFGIEVNEEIVNNDFIEKCKLLREDHRELFQNLPSSSGLETITSKMKQIRNSNFFDRANFYLKERIEPQARWYSEKAEYNRIRANFWNWVIKTFLIVALISAFMKVIQPWDYYPIEICLLVASFAFSWMQTKKFNELTSAYNLTAHEIADVKLKMEERIKQAREEKFDEFIADCENVFSREHTQWLARRDMLNKS